MKRFLYFCLLIMVLFVSSDHPTGVKEISPRMAEQQALAAIAAKYGLEKPEPPNDHGFPFQASAVRFDGISIENLSEAEVRGVLGEPVKIMSKEWSNLSSEPKIPYKHHVYMTDFAKIEVMFIEGKAVRIALKELNTLEQLMPTLFH
jgi:hypothetical protein